MTGSKGKGGVFRLKPAAWLEETSFMIVERFLPKQSLKQMDYADGHATYRPNRIQIAIWVGLLALTFFLFFKNNQSFQVGVWQDDVIYTILAQSLAYSDQYGLVSIPGEQPGSTSVPFGYLCGAPPHNYFSDETEPCTAPFPFGYPYLLLPFVLLFPGNSPVMVTLSLVGTLVNITLLFWGWPWFSRRSYWWGLAIVGLYTLSPLTAWHTQLIMAEPIFTTVCLIAILLAERVAQGKSGWHWSLLLSSVLALSVFIRTLGVILVVSIFAYILLARGLKVWKELLQLGIQFIIIVSFIIGLLPAVQLNNLIPSRYLEETNATFLIGLSHILNLEDEPSSTLDSRYKETDELGREQLNSSIMLEDFLDGIYLHLSQDFRQGILPFGGAENEQALATRLGMPSLPNLVGFFVSGLMILGFIWWLAKDGVSAFNLFGLFFIGSLFLWVWDGARILYPVQFQLHFAFLVGLEAVLLGITAFLNQTPLVRKFRTEVLVATVLLLLLIFAYKDFTIDDTRLHVGDFQARSSWLKNNTPSSVVVLTEAPIIDFLYSGRRTAAYPTSSTSPIELENHLAQYKVDYILIAPKIEWQSDYMPTYSDQTSSLLALLKELESRKQVMPVYSSDQDLIEVFRVQPGERVDGSSLH
jgi:hypothetical protein